MTVRGDSIVLADDICGTLSHWTVGSGGGFCIQNGELADSSAGENVMINSSSALFGNGINGADVKTLSGDYTDANLVVRYQNASNFYLIQVYGGQIIIFKKVSGTYYAQASVAISPHFTGGFYRLQATGSGGAFIVYWKGQQVLSWTDTSPWLSGKVGVRQCSGRNIHWDNFSAITFTSGQVLAYHDFYPFGQLMDGRSMVNGADARFKYTGKERDPETGWDYFGARYFDARVGRWLSVDPIAQYVPDESPYVYGSNNPIACFDPNGCYTLKQENGFGGRSYLIARRQSVTNIWAVASLKFVCAPFADLIRLQRQDPSIGIPNAPEMIWDLFSEKTVGQTKAKLVDLTGEYLSLDEMISAVNIDRVVFNALIKRGILLQQAPKYVPAGDGELHVGSLEAVDFDDTETLAVNPSWVEKYATVDDAMAALNEEIGTLWKREDFLLYAKLYQDAQNGVTPQQRAKMIRGSAALNPIYDATNSAPDATRVSH